MDGHNFQSHGMINKDTHGGIMAYHNQAEARKELSNELYRKFLNDRGKCRRWGLDKINEIADEIATREIK